MYLSTLSEWLAWIGSVHTREIELGLDRVKCVAERLGVLSLACPVVMVGGTNGKGSTVAGLEAVYRAAGYRVGVFTSPILFKHNEYVRINGVDAADADFCQAYEKISVACREVSLTPFEFHTLAALLMFQAQVLDVVILEVGMGGRLDAVNIIDADVAVVTSVALDHMEWLGETREAIAFEKAGIFRAGKPVVYGEVDVPEAISVQATSLGAPLFCQGRDFNYVDAGHQWDWFYSRVGAISAVPAESYQGLPLPTLALQNMSTVLMALTLLQPQLAVTREAIEKGLSQVQLTGRIQIVPGTVTEIYDVSHNPAAVAWLAKQLDQLPCAGRRRAVFSMLADKDIASSIQAIKHEIDDWYIAPLSTVRAASIELLQALLEQAGVSHIHVSSSLAEAYACAKQLSQTGDQLVIFGSFHTVAEVIRSAPHSR